MKTSCAKSTPPDAPSALPKQNEILFQRHHTSEEKGGFPHVAIAFAVNTESIANSWVTLTPAFSSNLGASTKEARSPSPQVAPVEARVKFSSATAGHTRLNSLSAIDAAPQGAGAWRLLRQCRLPQRLFGDLDVDAWGGEERAALAVRPRGSLGIALELSGDRTLARPLHPRRHPGEGPRAGARAAPPRGPLLEPSVPASR